MIRPEKSKRRIVIGIVAAVIVLLAIILMSIRITEITVTGNKQYTADELRGLLFQDKWDRNTIYCFYKDHFKEHEQIPFVEDYKIVFQSPTRVEIIVYEKSVESSSNKLEGIPWVTGLKFGHIALHQPLPVENTRVFDEILNLTQLLSTHEITVDRIQYDTHGNASLILGDITVYLGSNDQMSGKISELKDQLPVLTGLAGTLYLDTYDEAETATSYRFVKNK